MPTDESIEQARHRRELESPAWRVHQAMQDPRLERITDADQRSVLIMFTGHYTTLTKADLGQLRCNRGNAAARLTRRVRHQGVSEVIVKEIVELALTVIDGLLADLPGSAQHTKAVRRQRAIPAPAPTPTSTPTKVPDATPLKMPPKRPPTSA